MIGIELIQKNKFELSLQEQKIIAFICSKVKNKEELLYKFSIEECCTICNIDLDNYNDVKTILKKVADRSIWLENMDEDILVRWIERVHFDKKSDNVVVELDRFLVPFMFELGQKFTHQEVLNILAMKSIFSVRIYELIKARTNQGELTFDVDELKQLLLVDDVKSYNHFGLFKMNVLDKAQGEINELTDINISFEQILKGRKTVKVKFYIKAKEETRI